MKTIIHSLISRICATGVLLLCLTTLPAHALTNLLQQAYVKASNSEDGDYFGQSVAIDDNTMVIGANQEYGGSTGVNGNQNNNLIPGSGAAYVFVRYGSNWVQQAYLKASNTGTNDYFGFSVAISGNTIVVGSPGEASATTGVNGNQNDNTATFSGAAYVFVRNGTTWTQQAYLKASNTGSGDGFGWSVAVSGDTIVVGAQGEASNATGVNGNQANNSALEAGAAYVFVRNGTTWSQQAYLKASNTAGSSDDFGHSVAVSGDTVIVSAYQEDSDATGVNGNGNNELAPASGAVYVFARNGTIWSQQAFIKASNTSPNDNFGQSVSFSGNTLAVGASGQDGGANNSGAAYVFVRVGTNWTQQAYLKASNGEASDFFGQAVAVFNDILLVTAMGEDSDGKGINGIKTNVFAVDSGAAYVFSRNGTNWTGQYNLKASNTEMGNQFGNSACASSNTMVVGAYFESGASTGVNHSQVQNQTFNYASGAAFVFSEPVNLPPNTNFVAIQPEGLYLFTGTTGMFSAVITGETPLAYEWRHNTTPIPGATGSTLVFTNAQDSDTLGFYSLVVLFSNGLIASTNIGSVALFNSLDEIYLYVDPDHQAVPVGGTAIINAVPYGPSPNSFQWYKDNVLMPGATNAILAFPNAQLTNSADYTYTATYTGVTVSNSSAGTLLVYVGQSPVITHTRISPPGTFELTFTGVIDSSYQIDYSETLKPPVSWQYYDSVYLSANPVIYPIDIASVGLTNAFFRVSQLPP